MVTVTAVRPAARFGELELSQELTTFQEKPQLHDGWINGGFFVVEPEFFDLIIDDQTMLEREPLTRACELVSSWHIVMMVWHCMDSKRDRDLLESMWSQGTASLRILMHVLITGASGLVGSRIAKHLSSKGIDLRLASRSHIHIP